MRILVVNDDGVMAPGIAKLAKMASNLGEVWVVGPARQCSAMSQRVTIFGEMLVKEEKDFPIKSVKAFSVDGTPVDCVKVALETILPDKPDYVFSGVNMGYNCGHDIMYSGTIGAAWEALIAGIPAIAFSNDMNGVFDVCDEYMLSITKELLNNKLARNEIWNVNFPGCSLDECQGIVWDATPAHYEIYSNKYIKKNNEDGSYYVSLHGEVKKSADEGTDINYVLNNYISVGVVKNYVL